MKKEEERVSYIVNTIVDDWDSPKLYTEAYVSNLETQLKKQKEIINKAIEELKRGITFCKNDSQGSYDICNMAINREKKILEILEDKGE